MGTSRQYNSRMGNLLESDDSRINLSQKAIYNNKKKDKKYLLRHFPDLQNQTTISDATGADVPTGKRNNNLTSILDERSRSHTL